MGNRVHERALLRAAVFLTVVDIVLERDIDAVISSPDWAHPKPPKADDS